VSIIGMGLTYIAGNYIGYISIGLGLLYAVSLSGTRTIFGLLGVVLLATLGLLQIRDATTFEKPLMVFPRFVVPMFKRLTERETYPMAFLLGFMVSLFEFPCSGGVYIGIMFLLASNTTLYEGAMYLILYNLMFIAPLFIMLLAGSNSEALLKMDEWTEQLPFMVDLVNLHKADEEFLLAISPDWKLLTGWQRDWLQLNRIVNEKTN